MMASSIFLIPPKSKKSAEWPPLPNERRFTRVRAACDRCRIKKTKCDGTRPCLRCRHDDAICVDNRRGDRGPKMVSAEYVTMLEAQQEQLVKTLRKIHSQSLQNPSDAKGHGPSIQEILDNFPASLDDTLDEHELHHKKAAKTSSRSSPSQGNPDIHIPLPTNNRIPRSATFPMLSDSDLLNSLDVGQNNNIFPTTENLPELDHSVWDGLNLDLFNQWTMEPQNTNLLSVAQMGQTQCFPQSQMVATEQVDLQDLFCDPSALSIPSWQGMGLDPEICVDQTVNMDSFLRSYVS